MAEIVVFGRNGPLGKPQPQVLHALARIRTKVLLPDGVATSVPALLAGKSGATPALSRSCNRGRTPIEPLVAPCWCHWEGGQVGRSGSQNIRQGVSPSDRTDPANHSRRERRRVGAMSPSPSTRRRALRTRVARPSPATRLTAGGPPLQGCLQPEEDAVVCGADGRESWLRKNAATIPAPALRVASSTTRNAPRQGQAGHPQGR